MKKAIILIVWAALIAAGCSAPQFEVVRMGDRFDPADRPAFFMGKGNRLSAVSSRGGRHIDDRGLYIDPWALLDRESGRVLDCGFFILHYNYEPRDAFGPVWSVVFLTEAGKRVVLRARSEGWAYDVYGWNDISDDFDSAFWEKAWAPAAPEDLAVLAAARRLEVKVEGGRLSRVYGPDQVSDRFTANLRSFLERVTAAE
jgi:hypothetical protein